MRIKMIALALLVLATPADASECGMQINAIERRMHSTGAAEVTGQPASPASKSQASNAGGRAPSSLNPAQTPTPEKMHAAQDLIDKAKGQDRSGDKDGCERTMMEAQQTIGALP